MATAQTQTMCEAFGSSIRGDASPQRFEPSKASVVLNNNGYATYPMQGVKASRRVMSHAFEQQKVQENAASQDRQAARPQGQRFQAAAEWQSQNQQQRNLKAQVEEQKQLKHVQDSMAGIMHQLPEYQTSTANPLRPHTAPAGTTSGLLDDFLCSASPSPFCTPRDTARVEKALNLDGNLETGSLVAADEAQLQLAAEQTGLLTAREQERQQQLEDKAEEVLQHYPHGVPRRLQADLLLQGVEVPRVGFGCAHTAPHRDAAFTSRR